MEICPCLYFLPLCKILPPKKSINISYPDSLQNTFKFYVSIDLDTQVSDNIWLAPIRLWRMGHSGVVRTLDAAGCGSVACEDMGTAVCYWHPAHEANRS